MTMSSKHLALLFIPLSACIVENPFAHDDGSTTVDATETGDGDGDSGDGDGDGDPGDGDGDPGDGDGDPGDGDGDPGDGDGDPGDGDGDPGDGDGDKGCGRALWTFNFDNDQWTSMDLDRAWADASAPPCEEEVWAASYIEQLDHLLVFSSNGNYYRRVGANWNPPVTIGSRYTELNNVHIDSATYVPAINGDPANLIFTSLPNAYIYEYYNNGNVNLLQMVPLMDESNPGPPGATSVRNWALVLANPDKLGMADWWISWQGFDNGRVYRFDGAFVWSNWPENNSPLFSGGPGEPWPSNIEAAWGDYDLQHGYFIEH